MLSPWRLLLDLQPTPDHRIQPERRHLLLNHPLLNPLPRTGDGDDELRTATTSSTATRPPARDGLHPTRSGRPPRLDLLSSGIRSSFLFKFNLVFLGLHLCFCVYFGRDCLMIRSRIHCWFMFFMRLKLLQSVYLQFLEIGFCICDVLGQLSGFCYDLVLIFSEFCCSHPDDCLSLLHASL